MIHPFKLTNVHDASIKNPVFLFVCLFCFVLFLVWGRKENRSRKERKKERKKERRKKENKHNSSLVSISIQIVRSGKESNNCGEVIFLSISSIPKKLKKKIGGRKEKHKRKRRVERE